MSGGGGTTQSVTNNNVPEWVEKAGQANYDKALEIDKAPLQQYGGPWVAPQSDTTKQANQFFQDNMNAGGAMTSGAGGIFSGLAGSSNVDNIDKYMNPYIDNVETKALDALDRSRVQALNGNADRAIAAKSFGGSRGAIVDAVTNAESANNAGLLSAGLRKEGFDTATGLATADRASQHNAASGMLQTGNQQQNQMLSVFSGLTGIGALDQAQKQSEISADMKKFYEGRDKEVEDLNMRLSTLGMTPHSTSSTSTETKSNNPDLATSGLGVLSLLMGLSDDDTKTDKQKLGKDPNTGLDIWAYRYKGDPKTYPKAVGPMASDIKKKMPDALGPKVGGKQTVDYGKLQARGLLAGGSLNGD